MKDGFKACLAATVFIGFFVFGCLEAEAKKLPSEGLVFNTVEEKIAQAQKIKADMYIPNTYAEGMEYYNDAKEMYNEGDSLVDIKEAVNNAIRKFEKAIDDTTVASVFFTEAMIAKEDALKVNGPEHDPGNWQKAEKLFLEAAETLEEGDSKDAKEIAENSEKRYRDVELKAIQSKYLKNTWSQLNRTDNMGVEKYAPVTLKKAQNLAKKSAALLHLHRYDQTEAAQFAMQAEYEVNHAIYLAKKIKELEDSDQNLEAVLLYVEKPIKKIAEAVDLDARFDEGMEKPTRHIVGAIEKTQEKHVQLAKTADKDRKKYSQALADKDAELSLLQEQIVSMRNRLSLLVSKQDLLKIKVEQDRVRREKIARIGTLFLPSEGKALLDGENVLIRLHGLNFPSGKAVIESRYFTLLSKVKKSFAEFPGCNIIIEGHTDSQGSDDLNQTLSEKRAEAVKEYIIANSTIPPSRIQAIGYGETRPVANNETAAGQEKNRRIDVVIQPMY